MPAARPRPMVSALATRLRATAACFIALACASACTAPRPPRLLVILVDASASFVEHDWPVQREVLERGLAGGLLQPGDRAVVAPLHDRTFTAYRPAAAIEVPRTGVDLDDEDALARCREQLCSCMRQELAGAGSRQTRILDGLSLAARLAREDGASDVVVILASDMLESSPAAEFSKRVPSGSAFEAFVEKQRGLGLLPELGGARVVVTGASADTTERFHEVERFWRAYIEAAGGTCGPADYQQAGLPRDLVAGRG